MVKITSHRVEGKGRGTQIGFPTVNFNIDALPDGLSVGLWLGVSTEGRLITLISKAKSGFRLETHILAKRPVKIQPGDLLTINLIALLRGHKRIKDIQKTIEEDLLLAEKYFVEKSTCYGCKLYYTKDYGYSNYTVDGSVHGCFMKVYDEYETDWHETSDVIAHTGTECRYKSPGQCWEFDVDGNNPAPTKEWIDSAIRDAKLNSLLGD